MARARARVSSPAAPTSSAPDELDLGSMLEETRRLVLSRMGKRIAAAGADVDDIMQEVFAHILRAQARPGSRYDPLRGMSKTTYLSMVGSCGALNALRAHARRVRDEAAIVDAIRHEAPEQLGVSLGPAFERIDALLDLPEERAMARHLADGCSLAEIQRRMGISERAASELRVRVRALLLVLREE